MKVAKVLKLKNRIAGEIAELKDRLGKQNVRPEGQAFDYDNRAVLAELRGKIDELVRVKAALADANAAIYPDIFRLAELKGLLTTLRGLETRQGTFWEGHVFGQKEIAIEYRAQLAKAEVDGLAAEVENEITLLQDRLDEFNASYEVALPG
jgi:hypothetical protein